MHLHAPALLPGHLLQAHYQLHQWHFEPTLLHINVTALWKDQAQGTSGGFSLHTTDPAWPHISPFYRDSITQPYCLAYLHKTGSRWSDKIRTAASHATIPLPSVGVGGMASVGLSSGSRRYSRGLGNLSQFQTAGDLCSRATKLTYCPTVIRFTSVPPDNSM